MREEYSRRLSFTCGRCELRTTSASVRFAGRRVYLSVVLILVSPPGGASARALRDQLRIAAVTLKRWRQWWREIFPLTSFWHSVGERFIPPVRTDDLPHSLLERFEACTLIERLAHALRFIAPLSTRVLVR